MSSIVKVRDKAGRVYAYEQTAVWDPEKGQSRPKRRYLGRYDEATDTIIPSSGRRGRRKVGEATEPADATATTPAAIPDYSVEPESTTEEEARLRLELEAARAEAARAKEALTSALAALREAEAAIGACLTGMQ